MRLTNLTETAMEYAAKFLGRSKAARAIERAYNRGELKEGDKVKVTYEHPSFLSRMFMSSEDRDDYDTALFFHELPCSNTGRVIPAKTKAGVPYVRLDDESSGFTIDPTYKRWEKLAV